MGKDESCEDCGDKAESNKDGTNEELMKVILANEGDYIFILSLSGKIVKQTSSKAELRKAYLLLSTKVHPDKNPGSQSSKKAFQVLSDAFERIANPEKFDEDEDDDGKPAKKRQKTERFSLYVSNGMTRIFVVAGSERIIASWTNSYVN